MPRNSSGVSSPWTSHRTAPDTASASGITNSTCTARARPCSPWGMTFRNIARTGLRTPGITASLLTLAATADGNAKCTINAA